jgi:chromosome partitioning protein
VKTVSIISQKGGAGKTTLAIHLAVAAELAGKSAAIIDLDPQASAAGWSDHRGKERPAVVSAQASRLEQVLEAARKAKADLAIIDTAPHSESSALASAKASDLILIPCRPAILDLRAIHTTIELASLAKKPAAVVLNCVPARGSLAADAEEAIEHYGSAVCSVRIGHRAVFVHSLTEGLSALEFEPGGKGDREIKQLYKWVCGQVGVRT